MSPSEGSISRSSTISNSFQSFSLLPQELQDKIWLLSLPGPRLIEFRPRVFVNHILEAEDHEQRPLYYSLQPSTTEKYTLCVASSKVPPLLHVCSYTRSLASKFYSLKFSTALHLPIYFDDRRDRILLAGTWALRYFLERLTLNEVSNLPYVVLDPSNFITRPLDPRHFPGAEALVSVTMLAPRYGKLANIKLLISDRRAPLLPIPFSSSDTPVFEQRVRRSQDQTQHDIQAGIRIPKTENGDPLPPPTVSAFTMAISAAILSRHFMKLQNVSRWYRNTWVDGMEVLERWKRPPVDCAFVDQVLRAMEIDWKELEGGSDDVGGEAEIHIA